MRLLSPFHRMSFVICRALTRNIRTRRGSNVDIRMPLFIDENTAEKKQEDAGHVPVRTQDVCCSSRKAMPPPPITTTLSLPRAPQTTYFRGIRPNV